MYSTTYWIVFLSIVFGLLLLDLGMFNKKDHTMKIKEALGWSAFWIVIAIFFGLSIYITHGANDTLEYFSAYFLEKSLSIDNLFVFIIIFKAFKIEASHQHKILYLGILVCLILRGIFIYCGIELINKFAWTLYLFGGFLLYSGIKLFFDERSKLKEHKEETKQNKFIDFLSHKFSPFMGCLLAIEFSDIVFAVDSVPAVLSITQNSFIVYTSNIFAILGLRSLYFALDILQSKIKHMGLALAFILAFIGMKMLTHDFIHMPSWITFAVIIGSLSLVILANQKKRDSI